MADVEKGTAWAASMIVCCIEPMLMLSGLLSRIATSLAYLCSALSDAGSHPATVGRRTFLFKSGCRDIGTQSA